MLKWYGEQCLAGVRALVAERLECVAWTLRDYIREKLSVPNVAWVSKAGTWRVAKGSRGSVPSQPGEYPRKVLGHLRRSVQYEMSPELLVARVGTNVIYGKFLELGTRMMQPRPWLSRAIAETEHRLALILGGGPG